MWWLTLTACDGTIIQVPLSLILRILEIRPDEEPPDRAQSKIVFAGGSMQYLNMTVAEVVKTKAWKWPGVT